MPFLTMSKALRDRLGRHGADAMLALTNAAGG